MGTIVHMLYHDPTGIVFSFGTSKEKYDFSELRFVPGERQQHKIRSEFFFHSLTNLKVQKKFYLMVYKSRKYSN